MTTTKPTEAPAPPHHAPESLRAAWPALAGLSAVFLFEMLDNSILNVALPTIGRQLHTSTLALQWVTGSYAVVFGGLMLLFGAVADRFGRRRVMLAGLALLGAASLLTASVRTVEGLIAVRALMGAAAAMTAPGSIALTFRLFDRDDLRVRAITLISTVGLIGLAIGPAAGGAVLAVAPWQVLLLINAPIAALALVGIRAGVAPDDAAELHRDPLDVPGAALGTAAIVLALIAPTLFIDQGAGAAAPWITAAGAVLAAVVFVLRERSARYPLLDLALVARPLVSAGLAYKAASGLGVAGLGYMVTLQLQLLWGWPPALAALGMLPQVVVLLAAGPFVSRFVDRVGLDRAAWISAAAVVTGLAVYSVLGRTGYGWVAASLALEAAGMRVVGVVAGVNVLRGLPKERTSTGAALVDTASEVTTAIGIAVAGTVLAAVFTGSITTARWTAQQAGQFQLGVLVAGLLLTALAGVLVGWAVTRTRAATSRSADPGAQPASAH